MGNFTFLENRWSDLARLGDSLQKSGECEAFRSADERID